MIGGRAVEMLPIASIGELSPEIYVGMIDETAVEMLKARLAVEPLQTPIWVRRNGNAAKGSPYSVIAGRHRLRAATALGWSEIAAEVKAGPDSKPDDLRQLQLAENLDRRVPRPVEYACFMIERWSEAARRMPESVPANQQSRAVRARWSSLATLANTRSVDRADVDKCTADAMGCSPRKVRLYRKLYQNLIVELPDHFAAINAHPLGESLSSMMSLAQVRSIPARRKAAEVLLSRSDWPNISAVLVAAGVQLNTGNRPDRIDAVFSATWSKMSPTQRRVSALFVAREATPKLAREMFEVLKDKLP